jgi:hypothetical protein
LNLLSISSTKYTLKSFDKYRFYILYWVIIKTTHIYVVKSSEPDLPILLIHNSFLYNVTVRLKLINYVSK